MRGQIRQGAGAVCRGVPRVQLLGLHIQLLLLDELQRGAEVLVALLQLYGSFLETNNRFEEAAMTYQVRVSFSLS